MVLAVPVPANGVAGVDVSAAFWNVQVRDAATFLLNPPHCVMYQATSQSIGTGAGGAAITFDVNVVDSYSGHSTVTNNSRYVAQVAGWYDLGGVVAFALNTSTSYKFAQWKVNGSAVHGGGGNETSTNAAAPAQIVAPSIEVFLNVGDFVELWGIQNSGGALSTATGTAGQDSGAKIRWVHA